MGIIVRYSKSLAKDEENRLKLGSPLQWERRLDSRHVLTSHVSDKAESRADCWDAGLSSTLGDVGLCVEVLECSFKRMMAQNFPHIREMKHKEQKEETMQRPS